MMLNATVPRAYSRRRGIKVPLWPAKAINMASTATTTMPRYWLLKAEPDSRIVKGKDVKVSLTRRSGIFLSESLTRRASRANIMWIIDDGPLVQR